MNNIDQNLDIALEVLSKNTSERLPLPKAFTQMAQQDQHEIAKFISEIIKQEDEAYAKLFESLAMMMKYVPNFILHQIIPKYVEPAIAAKITSNLNTKQVIGVASGLSVDYIGRTAIYMENKVAAEVLEGLKRKLASQVIEYAVKNHPADALDILAHSHDKVKKEAKTHFEEFELEIDSLTPSQLTVYRALCVQ